MQSRFVLVDEHKIYGILRKAQDDNTGGKTDVAVILSNSEGSIFVYKFICYKEGKFIRVSK